MPQPNDLIEQRRASNRRTAWILASIAATFFVGVIAAHMIGSGVAVDAIGLAALLFIAVAIGRHLWRGNR